MPFIAGPYAWTFSGLNLGVIAEAPILTIGNNSAPITADVWGGQEVDSIYLGKTASLEFIFQEWDAPGVQAILQMFSGGGNIGSMVRLGCPMSNEADVLWGQRIGSGTPCGAKYAHFLAYRATLASNTPLAFNLGQELRSLPVRFELQPYELEKGTGSLHVFHFQDALPTGASNPPVKADANDLIEYMTALVAP